MMEENEMIKTILIVLVACLVFGVLGATLLQYGFAITGAACMIITGFLLGALFGNVFPFSDDEEGDI